MRFFVMTQRCLGAAIGAALLLVAGGCGGPTPAERFADAQAAVAAGQLRTADIHLRNLLVEQPDNAAARRMLGEVAIGLGNFSMAEAQLRRALELGIEPTFVQLPLLGALAGQRKFEEMLAQFDSSPVLSGQDHIEALRIAGAAYIAVGSPEAAESAYREALVLDPQSEVVRAELASLILAEGRAEEARELIANILVAEPEYSPALVLRGRLERIAGDGGLAERTFRQIMRLEPAGTPQHSTALEQLIEVLLARGAVEEPALLVDELLATLRGDPTALYLKARVEVAKGETEAARRRLEGVLAVFPNHTPSNRLLGAINADQGQLGQAEMYFQAAVRNAPEDEGAGLALAHIYLRQGKIDSARELLVRTFPAAESDAVLLALAGRASLAAGETEIAEEYFNQSDLATAGTPEHLYGLAGVYVTAGEFDRALRVLETAAADDANVSAASFMLSLTHLWSGDLDAAMRAARELAARLPDAAWPSTLQGSIALGRGDVTAAREHFTAALAVEPEHLPTMINLARAEVLLGNSDSATATLERVVEIDPEQTVVVLTLAELELRRGNFSAAAEWLSRAPDSTPRLRLEGALALANGRASEAAALFANVFERQPSSRAALEAFTAARRASLPNPEAVLVSWLEDRPDDMAGNFSLGSYLLEQGERQQAVSRFEAILTLDPDNAAALNNLAWLYSEQGDDRAMDLALRAYEVEPQNPAIADTVGWLYVQRGDAAGGLPFLEEAAAASPQQTEIQYHLAVALAETGRAETAIAVFEELLAQDVQFPWRVDAERRVDELRAQTRRR